MTAVERSCFTLDLGAVRRNAETLCAPRAAPSCGRSSRRTATATARSTSRGGARGRCGRALRRDAGRGARPARGASRRARHRHGAGLGAEVGDGARRAARARRGGRARPGGRPRPPQARHGHGPVGALRAARAGPRRRRRHEPPRVRRVRPGVHAASRSSASARRPPGSRARSTRHLANSAGTLRYPEARFDAVRCGIALYGISPFGGDPARRRARAGAALGVARRAREAPRAGREHGLRAAFRRGAADLDRGRPGRATRTGSGAT